MLLQTKNHRKSRKGVSIVVGYVLLISLAVLMGGILYAWMKSYIPRDAVECPEGASLVIKEYNYNCTFDTLNITLKNNGRFDIAGYYIHASDNSDIDLPTIDISKNITVGGTPYENSVIWDVSSNNTLKLGDEISNVFDVGDFGQIYYIQIIATRWQKDQNVIEYVSCGTVSTVKEEIGCS